MKLKPILVLFATLFLSSGFLAAQDFFRIQADFTTKIKPAEGKSSLTKGKVYYDKYTKELIYDISFPQKEKWVVKQSHIYKYINDSVYYSEAIPSMNEFTIFHLSLNSNLLYYGLNEARFAMSNVEKKDGLVISYWNVPQNIQNMVSSIAIAQKEQKLYSVVIFGQENRILSKQFFTGYFSSGGFEFPATVTQIFYGTDNKENYQVMEFKNIVLNDAGNEKLYRYGQTR